MIGSHLSILHYVTVEYIAASNLEFLFGIFTSVIENLSQGSYLAWNVTMGYYYYKSNLLPISGIVTCNTATFNVANVI